MSSVDFEEKVQEWLRLKERRKADKEQMDLLAEEIEEHAKQSMEDGVLVVELPDGMYAVIRSKAHVTAELDREGLANELLVAKDELKTPFDFSYLTKKGRLDPKMIEQHTHNRTEIKFKITKRQTRPRRKK